MQKAVRSVAYLCCLCSFENSRIQNGKLNHLSSRNVDDLILVQGSVTTTLGRAFCTQYSRVQTFHLKSS